MTERLKEACGLFGIYGHREAATLTYLGLYALQHRGQESAGIASSDGEKILTYKEMGLVSEVFDRNILQRLPGFLATGHVRYSTAGSSRLENAQPVVVEYSRGFMAVAHNGNLVNAEQVRLFLEEEGSIFQSTVDSEVIVHLIARSRASNFRDRVIEALKPLRGAYCFLLMNEKEIIAVRDTYGFRPLCLGKLGGAYVFASESCAFDIIDAKYLRDIEPGEMIIVNDDGLHSIHPFETSGHALCIFEFVYFARPDSIIFGHNVHGARKKLGYQLALEQPAEADLVIPVPDSSNAAALGYSEASGLPFELGLIRNHYIGRTFITPEQSIRDLGVKIKLNPVRDILEGKRVIVVDDSIVRGTTSRKIVKMLRRGGAKEVHLRISCPPIRYPCFYGIDTPTRRELIGATHQVEEILKYIGADSLGYASIEGMLKSMPLPAKEFCVACFDGKYPLEFPRETSEKKHFEKRRPSYYVSPG